MRTPFVVLNRTTRLDEFGQNVLDFLSTGTVIWGYLKGLSASEVVEREQVKHSRTYEIMIRAKERNLFSNTSRLQSDRQIFEIEGEQEYDDRQQTITLRVREIT
jgi:SPP1 family predicted phage head-tail adaptor